MARGLLFFLFLYLVLSSLLFYRGRRCNGGWKSKVFRSAGIYADTLLIDLKVDVAAG